MSDQFDEDRDQKIMPSPPPKLDVSFFAPNNFEIVVFVFVVYYETLRFIFKHLYIDNSVDMQYQFWMIAAIALKIWLIEFVFIL
jgi:hypothetical protein